jgi:sugar phosphate isomerase/epimerase
LIVALLGAAFKGNALQTPRGFSYYTPHAVAAQATGIISIEETARMAQLAMNEMTTYRWSFDQDVQQYLSAGIKAIGVWRQKVSDFGEEKAVDLLHESGLKVSSLLWAGGFTGSEGRTYKESLDDARDAIRLAAQMRAGCLIVYSGARAGHTHNHARRILKSALAELSPLAADLGVTLAIEPMHPAVAADWTFLTSLEETLATLDAAGNSAVKLCFDTYHLGQAPEVIGQIPQLASRLALVQLGDAKSPPQEEPNRCRLGEGLIPLQEIVAALLQAGYDGFFEVELMGEEIEAADYNDLLAQSKSVFQKLTGG